MKKPKNRQNVDVNNQKHYTQHEIQVIEFCERNKLGWCVSNVIKYVCRAWLKNGIEDLKKALSYLVCLIIFKESGKFHTPDQIIIIYKLKG